ncbi:hypothetical protein GJ496_008704 [Pomphorhynchus laevis]|nr:hypothetical protein GJ496_008704 [Pomphorhynchus laevis]
MLHVKALGHRRIALFKSLNIFCVYAMSSYSDQQQQLNLNNNKINDTLDDLELSLSLTKSSSIISNQSSDDSQNAHQCSNSRPQRSRMLSYYKLTNRPKLVIVTCILPVKCCLVDENVKINEYKCGLFVDELCLGWPRVRMPDEKTQESIRGMLSISPIKMIPVFMSDEEIDSHMSGFCRKVIYANFHNMPHPNSPFINNSTLLRAYECVNRKFANTALECNGDIYWILGHELMLVPQMLREQGGPDLKIGFFLYIPFPVEYYFFTMPNRRQVLEGMLGADLIGFQTYDFFRSFVSCVYKIMGKTCTLRRLELGDRLVTVGEFPMGISYEYFTSQSDDDKDSSVNKLESEFNASQQTWKMLSHFNLTAFDSITSPNLRSGNDITVFPIFKIIDQLESVEMKQTLIISSDRLDESSEISLRITAYRVFLEKYPDYKTKVVLLLLVQPPLFPSETFNAIRDEINQIVANVNGSFSTMSWKPIVYLYGNLSLPSIKRLMSRANICLAVSLKSGMGLLSKEYVAVRYKYKSGVLILSENTGSSKELNSAILVNPYDSTAIAEAIHRAIQMPLDDQSSRLQLMQERLCRNDINRWATNFVDNINDAFQMSNKSRTQRLAGITFSQVVTAYRTTETKRLLILDYDGTLAELTVDDQPPDSEILHILNSLAADPKNTVVINSGRDKETLEKWFQDSNFDISAEHGIWIRKAGHWTQAIEVDYFWKSEVLGIVESLFENMQGLDIVETDYSVQITTLNSDSSYINNSSIVEQLRDRIDTLRSVLSNNPDVRVIENSRRLEIKSAIVSKGRAILNWLRPSTITDATNIRETKSSSECPYEFVLAMGDDYTDEDTFRELPATAITVKVGITSTDAKFYLMNTFDVRMFLRDLIRPTFISQQKE